MNEITLTGHELLAVAIAPDALALKEELLTQASWLEEVIEDDETAQKHADMLSRLNKTSRAVDKGRKDCGDPLRFRLNEINEIAKQYVKEIDEQIGKISKNMANWETKKFKLAQEEKQRQAEALRKIEEEKLKLAQEEARIQEEANQKLLAARTVVQAQQAVEAQKTVTIEIEAKKEEVVQRQIEIFAAPSTKPVKTQGTITRTVYKFELLDITALYNARPELVKMEPATAAINNAIKYGLKECPGLKIWEELAVTTR